MPTWSPGPTPWAARWWARRLARASISAYVRRSSPATRYSRSPKWSTACSNRSARLNSNVPPRAPARTRYNCVGRLAAPGVVAHEVVDAGEVGAGLLRQRDDRPQQPGAPDDLGVVLDDQRRVQRVLHRPADRDHAVVGHERGRAVREGRRHRRPQLVAAGRVVVAHR